MVRIDRVPHPTAATLPTSDILTRNKRSISADLKTEEGKELVKRLAQRADVVIDPFRPGVLEKLGLGPNVLMKGNDRLIYARLTGFRRDGKYKDMAGHDISQYHPCFLVPSAHLVFDSCE